MRNYVPTRLARRASKVQGRRPVRMGALQSEMAEKINPPAFVGMDKRVRPIHKRPAIGEIKCDRWSAIGRAPSLSRTGRDPSPERARFWFESAAPASAGPIFIFLKVRIRSWNIRGSSGTNCPAKWRTGALDAPSRSASRFTSFPISPAASVWRAAAARRIVASGSASWACTSTAAWPTTSASRKPMSRRPMA